MTQASLRQEVVGHVASTMERVGLSRSADELVVVGGTAMAALGIKQLNTKDLDIVGTHQLIDSLEEDKGWLKAWEIGQSWQDNTTYCPSKPRVMPLDDGRDHTVSLLRAPFDKIYPLTAEELIAEAVVDAGTGYKFSPPPRILDWKLALVGSDLYLRDKIKHIEDAKRISAYLLTLPK